MTQELIDRARELAAGPRRLLGIAGAPAAGKTTLARQIAGHLGDAAIVVPMDGFHLADVELKRLGNADRKGAPDTFDGYGYVAMLCRLRDAGPEIVYVPAFERELEQPIAGSIAVPPDIPLVITEGNYLLRDTDPWRQIRPLLDECWWVSLDDEIRLERLIARHVEFGKPRDFAESWVARTDQANARTVAEDWRRADRVIRSR
jgi:pantothenate kinase